VNVHRRAMIAWFLPHPNRFRTRSKEDAEGIECGSFNVRIGKLIGVTLNPRNRAGEGVKTMPHQFAS